uniref:NADH-ubiquinone oxidoreductase chain 1 n=1 Tax=Abacion magnum TaxID=118452 RepID=S4SZW5_ABAMA|nr:NADH dehydrogenase subunit 1 [Abacion magnum]AFR77022.1 NADH dehydrogenase subunit 1 [Abacion magnum]
MNFVVLLNFYVLIIMVLVSVAFFTLLERKVLGYIQIRKGPNKVGVVGILQPFADAVKLFTKEVSYPWLVNFYPYFVSPCVMIGVMLVLWAVCPLIVGGVDFYLGLLFFVCCTALGVYSLLGCGWASNSKYAMLGAMRGVAQTISYEVSMIILLLSGVILTLGYDLEGFKEMQKLVWFIFILFPVFCIWLVSSLAETNRSPFDFAEGESELVSGFNVEYSGGGFAMLFLAEYGSIIFMSVLLTVLYLGGFSMISVGIIVWFMFIFLWVRGTLPRYRYDKLMGLAWKSFLPMSLNYLLFLLGFVMLVYN